MPTTSFSAGLRTKGNDRSRNNIRPKKPTHPELQHKGFMGHHNWTDSFHSFYLLLVELKNSLASFIQSQFFFLFS